MVGVGDRGTGRGETNEARRPGDRSGTSSIKSWPSPAAPTIAGVRTILVVMGVSGSGKTTIAKAPRGSTRLGFRGRRRSPSGIGYRQDALRTSARRPRPLALAEKVAEWIDGWRQAGKSGVITCSALKRSYRDFLVRGRPDVRSPLFARRRSKLIAARLTARKEHFMPASLLDSQLATLEEPDPDEQPIYADVVGRSMTSSPKLCAIWIYGCPRTPRRRVAASLRP